jgi:hypothetical protein
MPNAKLKKKKESNFRRLRGWLVARWPSFAVVATLIALYSGYVNLGTDSLRSDIYQPLYREINVMDESVQNNSMEKNFSAESYDAMRKNGNLFRIPKSLRNKIIRVYELSSQEHSHVFPLVRLVAYKMPTQITAMRNEAQDREWADSTVVQLNSQLKTPVELYGFSFQMSHTARSPAVTFADPHHPRITNPGMITWELNDWMQLPQSASSLKWPDTWFLSFDEHNDGWYYRINHDDLNRLHMSLNDFLRPMYKELSADPDFQQILEQSKECRALLDDVKAEVAERVVHPRHLWDLVEF